MAISTIINNLMHLHARATNRMALDVGIEVHNVDLCEYALSGVIQY